MLFAFYLSGIVAIFATIRVITNANPVHGLLYLVISLLSVAMIFFAIGAPFAGALEIVVYASAIVVLFMFTIMMLNLGNEMEEQERQWTRPILWIGPGILAAILLVELVYVLWTGELTAAMVGLEGINSKQVGIALYGPYLLCVELASVLLLAALVAAYHLGRASAEE
jgi:NADH-quinone oxidoreductase subunit J